MAAVEFWRGRAERLPSRWPVIVIFASFALFFAARIPLIGIAAVSVRRAADGAGLARRFQSADVRPHHPAVGAARVAVQGAPRARPAHQGADRSADRRAQPPRLHVARRAPAAAPRPRARAAVPAVPRPRPLQVAQRPLRSFRRRRRADELRRPGERLHPADGFPVPHRRRGVLLPAAVHHHRAGASRGRAHPPPVRDDDGERRGHAGEGDGEPRHRLDRGLRL